MLSDISVQHWLPIRFLRSNLGSSWTSDERFLGCEVGYFCKERVTAEQRDKYNNKGTFKPKTVLSVLQ